MKAEEEFRKRLAEPMPYKFKPGWGSGSERPAMPYIETEAVIERLTDVFGLGGWKDEYSPLIFTDRRAVLKCRLWFKIGDEWTFVEGIGEDIQDREEARKTEKETGKTAESDSLKRAARKIGIGKFLYRLKILGFPYSAETQRWVLPLEEMQRRAEGGEAPEAEEIPVDACFCADCGKEIFASEKYTLRQKAEMSTKKTGKILCWNCQQKILGKE